MAWNGCGRATENSRICNSFCFQPVMKDKTGKIFFASWIGWVLWRGCGCYIDFSGCPDQDTSFYRFPARFLFLGLIETARATA
jgi:hypothetical protein